MDYKNIIVYIIIVFAPLYFISCNWNKIDHQKSGLYTDSLNNNAFVQDVTSDWEIIDQSIYTFDSIYYLSIYKFEGGNSKHGPIASVLKLYNKDSNLLWRDTLSTIYPEDIFAIPKGNKIIVQKNESAISYHQYVIIDFKIMKIVKSFSYDRDFVLRNIVYDSVHHEMKLIFIDLADSSLTNITEFEEFIDIVE